VVVCSRLLGLAPGGSFFFLVLEPDRAGCAELAVYVGIAALQAFFAQIDAVLGAHEAGFPVRVMGTGSHESYSVGHKTVPNTISAAANPIFKTARPCDNWYRIFLV
jgi:hypothetical protein